MQENGAVTRVSDAVRESVLRICGQGSTGALRVRVLSGSMTMLLSSGFVGAINLVYNLAIAHGLGAAGFGHASAVYTVLMLLSSVTLSFQILCSKFVAKNETLPAKIAIYRYLHRRSWIFATGITAALLISSPVISAYLNLPTSNYILLLGMGILFYIPLGVRRGLMQGMFDFPHLAFNFALEAVVKLLGALLLVQLGFSVAGVIAAVTVSIVLAYFVARPGPELATPAEPIMAGSFLEGVQASVFFVGQVIINNLDIILVKHFFDATQAGVYAAVALVGRIIYILSWSVVNGMFPFSAESRSQEHEGRTVLTTALLMVVLITTLFTLAAWLAPQSFWHTVLGKGFPLNDSNPYSSLLVLYAATTGIYSLSVVLMSYEIARRIGHVSWLQLGFSAAIVVAIYLVHGTLRDVITVQLVLMVLLLVTVSIPFIRSERIITQRVVTRALAGSGMHRIRLVKEDEVISEFLRSEFYHPEFDDYREHFRDMVEHPDLDSPRENELRRALLFLRRGRLWRELPANTEWWQMELQPADYRRLRVFPRNHWRSFAKETFYLAEMVDGIRHRVESDQTDRFSRKLSSLREEFAQDSTPTSSVLLIGIDEEGPLTIIEGNHRMAAASLISPGDVLRRFQFLVGFSPRMTECCWYQTDLSTLLRYARHFATYFLNDHKDVIERAVSEEKISSDNSVGAA
jgi:O-antigen/teichoic acid export membrane protein